MRQGRAANVQLATHRAEQKRKLEREKQKPEEQKRARDSERERDELKAAWEQEKLKQAEKEAKKEQEKRRLEKANKINELQRQSFKEATVIAGRAAKVATAAYKVARQKGAMVNRCISAKSKREEEADAKRLRLQAKKDLEQQPPSAIKPYTWMGDSESEELSDDDEDLETEFSSLDADILAAKQVHEKATATATILQETADEMQRICDWKRVLNE